MIDGLTELKALLAASAAPEPPPGNSVDPDASAAAMKANFADDGLDLRGTPCGPQERGVGMSDDKKPSATLPTSTIEHNKRLDAQALRQEQIDGKSTLV